MRCVEAISVVRSGLTKPFSIARPASMSSGSDHDVDVAGLGVSSTGSLPPSTSRCAGKISR